MSETRLVVAANLILLAAIAVGGRAQAQAPPFAAAQRSVSSASVPIAQRSKSANCRLIVKANGYPLPDPQCTPGAVNPYLTAEVLSIPNFSSKMLRNDITTESDRMMVYEWYGIPRPGNNTGSAQTCELDHLIPLDLGGADSLDNIWPQCGPAGVALTKRYFRLKDIVENYLAWQVRKGAIKLASAQQGIAADWTQFLEQAQKACGYGRCR